VGSRRYEADLPGTFPALGRIAEPVAGYESDMPRSIWNGALSFGLVNVPIQLYSAVEPKDVHFHEFQAGTGTRIKHKRVSEKTGREVDYGDIEKGFETSRGKYVMLTREELESVEPGRSRTIEIEDFVELAEIDPIFFDKPYYVVPQKGAEKPYALLRAAMEATERVAIARFVMRTKQYLAAIRVNPDGVLLLETLYFYDEIRDPKALNIPRRTKVPDKELRIAQQLIDSLTVPWKPERYEDTYRERVLDLVRRKGRGQEIDVSREEPQGAEVVDLVEALQRSLEARKRGRARKPAKKTTKRARKRAS
jgi:DNA end-binding protein Ku